MTAAAPAGWHFKPTLWATLAAAAALVVLLGLGAWQLIRLDEKQAIIDARSDRLAAPPLTLAAAMADPQAAEGRRVRVTGHFLHDRELHLIGRSYQGMSGLHVITPLVETGGPAVLVDRGWVPFSRRDPARRLDGQVEGPVTLDGVVRTGGWTGRSFARPDNMPEENHWIFVDVPEMAAAAGLDDVAPFYVTAAPNPAMGALPVAAPARVEIRNDHLGYAFTWFSLAAGLVAVYVLFHLRRGERAG